MNFALSEDQTLIQQTARQFATQRILPESRALDRNAQFPTDIVRALGGLGLMGVCVPESYGGAGADNVSYVLAIEELSRACASTGVIASVNNSLVCDPIQRFGNEDQKRAWLPKLASGEALGCFGLTEPSSGSDAAEMDTVAVSEGDTWRIDGSKNWITNGPHADVMLVFAMTDESKGHRGISAFLVPTATPGFTRDPHDDKLGIQAAHSCTVFFESCRLPSDAILGQVGDGFKIAMATLDGGRLGIAAQAIGIAQAAFEKAVAYSHERTAFREKLCKKQAIRFKIADMATDIEAARLLTLRAACDKDSDIRYTQAAATAKLFASEMATRVTHQALQIFGGYGYSKEYDLERHYRDARITEIYEGTSEIMRLVIAAQERKMQAA